MKETSTIIFKMLKCVKEHAYIQYQEENVSGHVFTTIIRYFNRFSCWFQVHKPSGQCDIWTGGKLKQDQVNNANSAFIFMINLLIIQGCQSGSVGRGHQLVRLFRLIWWSRWSGLPGWSGWFRRSSLSMYMVYMVWTIRLSRKRLWQTHWLTWENSAVFFFGRIRNIFTFQACFPGQHPQWDRRGGSE